LARMALRSRELKKSAEDCGCERVSEGLEDEDGTYADSVGCSDFRRPAVNLFLEGSDIFHGTFL
jgi:hypothetical protein